jgi:hypothetical protein
MDDTREQLADLFRSCRERQRLGFARSLADEAIAIVHRELVEVCCAGAVVGQLPACPAQMGQPCSDDCERCEVRNSDGRAIPIAQTIEPLVGDVARELLEQYNAPDRLRGCELIGVPAVAPPFAASYYDANGVRTYVLAAAECAGCALLPGESTNDCEGCDCNGTTADVRSIADRYQPGRPWRDEDTPRLARFEVRR